MAAAFRILLWALVLIAPGGILLAPLLAAHELRRRTRANAAAANASTAVVRVSQVPAGDSQVPATVAA
ncbi:MAG TPA: hypothetical protein VF294_13105 [Polyangiaceae bacterium]